MALSLRDLDDRFQELSRLHAESEADRAAILRNLQAMEDLFAKQQAADHARQNDAREGENARLAGHVQDLRTHVEDREAQIEKQAIELRTLREMALALNASVEEREARIEKQAIELRSLRETTLTLNTSAERYAGEAAALAGLCQELRGQAEEQTGALQSQESLLARVRLSYVFRLMRAFRLWGWLSQTRYPPHQYRRDRRTFQPYESL